MRDIVVGLIVAVFALPALGQSLEAQALNYVQTALRRAAFDEDSVKFRDSGAVLVQTKQSIFEGKQTSGSLYCVYTYMNAKNRLGAYVGYQAKMVAVMYVSASFGNQWSLVKSYDMPATADVKTACLSSREKTK